MPWHNPVIIQNVRPEIVDTPLMLISMMGHGACALPVYLLCLPKLHHWTDATVQPADCWICMAINRWRSSNSHLWAHLRDILRVIGCSTIVHKMHTVSIGRQYSVAMYYHLNPRSSRQLSCSATTIHVFYMRKNEGRLCFNAFGRHYTA
jgi:hypothetical protein